MNSPTLHALVAGSPEVWRAAIGAYVYGDGDVVFGIGTKAFYFALQASTAELVLEALYARAIEDFGHTLTTVRIKESVHAEVVGVTVQQHPTRLGALVAAFEAVRERSGK